MQHGFLFLKSSWVLGLTLLILLASGSYETRLSAQEVASPSEQEVAKAPLPGAYEKVTAYREQLTRLAPDKPESILQAKELYFGTFARKDDQVVRDNGFLAFRDFYYRVLHKLQKTELALSEKVTPRELGPHYAKYGFALWVSEGDYFIEDAPGFLRKSFGGMLSPMWEDFLEFQTRESEEGYLDDASLLISWDKLRQRIVFWESFLERYPEFPRKEEVTAKIHDYLYIYLSGTDNTGIGESFGHQGQLAPDVRASYQGFIETQSKSRFHPLVSEYFQLLKSHAFKVEPYLEEFRRKQDILSENNAQPWIGKYFGKRADY